MKKELQDIREACIKANPEIVELKFGCTVKFKGGKPHIIYSTAPTSNFIYCVGRFRQLRSNIKEILGRPVRLSDVLLAIGGESTSQKEQESYSVNLSKLCGFGWNVCWDLRNDNLDNQSPETISFIHSLLNK